MNLVMGLCLFVVDLLFKDYQSDQKLKTRMKERQGLKPKPKKVEYLERQVPVLEDTHIRKTSSSGLCSQVEKLVLCNKYREAMELFEILEIEHDSFDVGGGTYDALVNACVGLRSIRGVKRVFSYMLNSGFEPDLYLMNKVLFMHVKCGLMLDACKLFDEMTERDMASWMTIIGGLVDSGNFSEAFRLFLYMWEEFNDGRSRTFATMIRASTELGLLQVGKQIHSCALKRGVVGDNFVACALIDMYNKCGSIEDAHNVFDLRILKYHSEKLAIAFGLINTPHWTHLQITQGHRLYGDCHSAIKLIAMVTGREIV